MSWYKILLYSFAISVSLWYAYCLPQKLFDHPYSKVVLGRNGELIGASVSSDGQWRFQSSDKIPVKFETCVLTFEDRYFYYHPGINPWAIVKALWKNIKAKKVINGGSTITQQTIRLYRDNPPRTLLEKIYETILATRLEFGYSKEEILRLYSSQAPFGGNVIGLEAASWRYYQKPPTLLSWAESATLAVLPNAPGLIFPGRRQELLKQKRNRLLNDLFKKRIITEETFQLSLLEELPAKPEPLPEMSYHLVAGAGTKQNSHTIYTTLDGQIQERVLKVLEQHTRRLSQNKVHNMAALVVDMHSLEVLSYVGNSADAEHEGYNDMVVAPRSTGSILKPILFASLIEDGTRLQGSLVADIPTYYSSFTPMNFNKTFDGAVPMNEALARSLNIPYVRLLDLYGKDKFLKKLQDFQQGHIDNSSTHYGLSLILGGAESSLWDLCQLYAAWGKVMTEVSENPSYCLTSKDINLKLFTNENKKVEATACLMDAGSIYLTLEAMTTLNRPDEESGWTSFYSSEKIAWKTGTSFGHKDAWAIGMNGKYLVGVFAGNANGEGRPGLTGTAASAPALFDIFDQLPDVPWFYPPFDQLRIAEVCTKSGFLAGSNCEEIDSIWVSKNGLRSNTCPYHTQIQTEASSGYRVNTTCADPHELVDTKWFLLPAGIEWYYKQMHPGYKQLPPLKEGCSPIGGLSSNIQVFYPPNRSKIFIPRDWEGTRKEIVFHAGYRYNTSELYWHIDNSYAGMTKMFHQIALKPSPGQHTLTISDKYGESVSRTFTIVE